MKKLVLILVLMFAIGMQAKTQEDVKNVKQGITAVKVVDESPGTRWKCTSHDEQFQYSDGDGGFYIRIEIITVCKPYAY